jgi:hypothetical protein
VLTAQGFLFVAPRLPFPIYTVGQTFKSQLSTVAVAIVQLKASVPLFGLILGSFQYMEVFLVLLGKKTKTGSCFVNLYHEASGITITMG